MVFSHIMAQVAMQPGIRLVFDELFTAGGAELEFRPVSEFALKSSTSPPSMTFSALEAMLAERGETLLGVQQRRVGQAPLLTLNPARSTAFELGEKDQFCVLTRTRPLDGKSA
jgi:hypothetical protein